jgi:hypothetical protein
VGVGVGVPTVACIGATDSNWLTRHRPFCRANVTFQRKRRSTAASSVLVVIFALTATSATAESSSIESTATCRTLASPLFWSLPLIASKTAFVTVVNSLKYDGVSSGRIRFW